MIKIEAITLEEAYSNAASQLDCSVTELVVEVVQYPSSGFLGLFRKKAIIVATKGKQEESKEEEDEDSVDTEELHKNVEEKQQTKQEEVVALQTTPSFVSSQEESFEEELEEELTIAAEDVVGEIEQELQRLFSNLCFELDEIKVSVYDENTIYIELNGEDAALLIGKEGYRYKALSYMLFNWINSTYGFGLRLEIAEFLQNQEEAVRRYLESVKESVDRDGRAQTKILDGVLVQIALRELRATYPDKYVAIRTTRDGLKYIIINDYNY
jgi:spoIIIJ-associated protein